MELMLLVKSGLEAGDYILQETIVGTTNKK